MATTTTSSNKKTIPSKKLHKCYICGKESRRLDGVFVMSSPSSKLFLANDGYTPFCKKCINNLFIELEEKYGRKTACKVMCAKLDIPFITTVFLNLHEKDNAELFWGAYSKTVTNLIQYKEKTFTNTIADGELEKNDLEIQNSRDSKWKKSEIRNKNYIIDVVGYDPFDGYPNESRKFLFNQLLPYIESDDDIADDNYKLSAIIQIVDNNNQIRQYDKIINSLNPLKDGDAIKNLENLKSTLSAINDKTAKENEISVKNRSNKDAGKNTLTYMMRDLREKNFDKAEADYYDQLRGEGTRWANDISQKSILAHCLFDENDKKEVYEDQLKLINNLYQKLDDQTEKVRVQLKKIDLYEKEFRERGIKIPTDEYEDNEDDLISDGDDYGES